MKLLESPYNCPYSNMALELLLLDQKQNNFCVIYKNKPSILSGRFQIINREINHTFIASQPIPIVRRFSGGGTVYHDEGNINISYIVNSKDFPKFNQVFLELIFNILKSFKIPEIHIKKVNIFSGKYKICGSALYKKGNRIVNHFCILIAANQSNIDNYLTSNYGYITKGTKSDPALTTNICEIIGETKEKIERNIFNHLFSSFLNLSTYKLTRKELEQIDKMSLEYSTLRWKMDNSPDYTFVNAGKIHDFNFEIMFNVIKGVITTAKIETKPTAEITEINSFPLGKYHSFPIFFDSLMSKYSHLSLNDLLNLTNIFFVKNVTHYPN